MNSILTGKNFFVFLLLLSLSTPSTPGILVDTAQSLERSYNKAKTTINNHYDNLTNKFHPQPVRYLESFITRSNTLPTSFFWGITMPTADLISTNGHQSISPAPAVAALKQAGASMCHIALDWRAIEPQEGAFNTTLLDQHASLCQELTQQNITPLITLFESSAPEWFMHRKGFLVYENIPFFVRYAHKVAAHLKTKNAYWITLLNPNSYAAQTHTNDLKSILTTLEHMIRAHRDIYNNLKNSRYMEKGAIGIAFNTDPILPWHKLNPSHIHKAGKLNQALHTSWLNLLNTGSMDIDFFEVTKNEFMHSICNAFDFIGITYNAPQYIDTDYKKTVQKPQQDVVQNGTPTITRNSLNFRIDPELYGRHPEGLYESIKNISKTLTKKVPLLVMHREPEITNASVYQTYYQHNVAAISKAHQEGCNVMGYVTSISAQ